MWEKLKVRGPRVQIMMGIIETKVEIWGSKCVRSKLTELTDNYLKA